MRPALRRTALLGLLLSCTCASAPAADDAPALRNWFGDPFMQVRDGLRGCPEPKGPRLTEAEMRGEAHSRIERGTSCWMAGTCSEPNAYRYDAAIAQALQRRFEASPALRDASLWILASRRFVWIQGCIARPADRAALEALAAGVPDVERVLVDVMEGAAGKPPYAVLPR